MSAAPTDTGTAPVLAGPDEESRQWVGAVAHLAGLPFIVGRKQRRGDRDVIVTFEDAAQIAGRPVVLVDDLISSGRTLIEAAAIDGAGEMRRFWTIVFPLLSPTTFFLVVVNLVYAFFDTFGIIHAVTGGGPANATQTLVYKVYKDGVHNLDLGSSAAQSTAATQARDLGNVFIAPDFRRRPPRQSSEMTRQTRPHRR